MADTTKKADNAKKSEKVQVKIPKLMGQNAVQEEYFSVNGRTYRVKRGIYVDVPKEVKEVIENNEKAEEYAMKYVEDLEKAKNKKEEELGLK